jgi:hypothetical protein
LKITKERVRGCHTTCDEKVKGLCQVKLVPSIAHQTIWFGDLTDPRPIGRASLWREGGFLHSSYVLQECKDLLGKFGKVWDEVFYGGQSVVHLTNIPTYQNQTMHHFIRQVIEGGIMVHTRANCVDMFTQ